MNSFSLIQLHKKLVQRDFNNPLRALFFCLLIPFAWLYGAIGWIRAKLYQFQVFNSYRSSLPVLSVGNLAAGGTGKTPTVDWLTKGFQQKGKRVAVLSRGYGGTFGGRAALVSDGHGLLMTASECGDEPCLIAKQNPGLIVAIARKRVDGLRMIEELGLIDLVILDDAFQHLAVKRDVDLVLLDERLPLGNGWPLPAGNLREFSSALKRADFFMLTRAQSMRSSGQLFGKPVYTSQHRLSSTAISLQGKVLPLSECMDKKIVAFAGIANPEDFFNFLEESGIPLFARLALSDHVQYDAATIRTLNEVSGDVDLLLTTGKDAVKLRSELFSIPCYQVPLEMHVSSGESLLDNLQKCLWGEY